MENTKLQFPDTNGFSRAHRSSDGRAFHVAIVQEFNNGRPMRIVLKIVGVLFVPLGGIWFLQGINALSIT
jgi:hypothetical protein